MAESAERVETVWERLRTVERMFGGVQTAEALGVTPDVLVSLLAGEVEMDPGVLSRLDLMCGGVEDATDFVGIEAFPGGEVGGDEVVVAVDVDGDGRPDLELGGVGLVTRSESWTEELERKRVSFRSARSLALMTQFRLGMPYQQHVAALGLLAQVELALIMFFRESVPEAGVNWGAEQRAREIDRRLARIRWVEREQEKEYTGWRGVWNSLVGRRRLSGKELYALMLEEAEGLMTSVTVDTRGVDVLEEVMKFVGVDGRGG